MGPTAPINSVVSMRGSNWVKYAQDDSINYAPHKKKELNVVLWQTKGWRVGRGKTMTRTASSALRWQTKGNKWGKPTYQRHGNRAEARTFEHSRFGPWKGLQSTSSTADTWKSVHNKFDNELWNFCQIVTLFGIVGNPCPTCHSWNLFCCHKFWNNNYCHL